MRTFSVWSCVMFVAIAPVIAAPKDAQYVDLTDDYVRFVDGTVGVESATRIALFRRQMDALLPGFYEPRNGESSGQYDAHVSKALQKFSAQRAGLERVQQNFPAAFASGIEHFRKYFPGWMPDVPVYLVHSLGEMDGGVRTLDGKRYLIFGADVIAQIHDAHTLTPFLDHELFHVENGKHFPECPQVWCTLWAEGLATYAAEVMTPGADDRQLLLMNPEPIRAATDARWRDALCFTRAKLDSSADADVEALFVGGESTGELPKRFGYYVGLRAIESLNDRYDLRALAHMPPAKAKKTLSDALAGLIQAAGGCR